MDEGILNNNNFFEVLKNIKKKKLFSRYFILVCTLFISAISFNMFLFSTKIVAGGVGGLSIIMESLLGIKPSLFILVLGSSLLIVSLFALGFEKTSSAVVSTLIYPFLVEVTAPYISMLRIDTSDLILVSLIVGIISGVTSGITFKIGFSGGGFNIISQILYKHFKISLSKASLTINSVVVLIGGFVFGWEKVMYAIIILYISSVITDKVLLGISKNKCFYIITKKEKEIEDYIINNLKRGVTVFDTKGGFILDKKKMLMTVIPSKEYFLLKEGITMVDNEAFVVVSDAYQVDGGK
ncbi:MAG: YitT family protein [Bacilli bacterium]